MHKTIEIKGKPLVISTTKEADAVLSSRNLPLIVEMELLFDALLSKKVRFLAQHYSHNNDVEKHPGIKKVGDDGQDEDVFVNEKLYTRFRPVMMECHNGEQRQECKITDFPIVKISPYVPKWLRIDFRFGHWFGEFGY